MATVYLLVTIAVSALAATLPKSSEISGVAPRIINLDPAHFARNIPYQVFLEISKYDGEKFICGGSLISPIHVLTAAHCLEEATEVKVISGTDGTLPNGDIQISKIFKIHENYNKAAITNDIALIKLPQPVKLSEKTKIIALPKNNIGNNYLGVNALISGWGSTTIQNNNLARYVKFGVVRIVRNDACNRKLTDYTILCASYVDGKSCKGDSGSPLVVDGVQIGIFSYFLHPNGHNEQPLCLPEYAGAYTNVSSYLDWIKATAAML